MSPFSASDLLTGGTASGLILAVVYAWQQYRRSRHEDRVAPSAMNTTAVTDAATANSMLLASLREEREETQRLSGRVSELETQNALLYERMRDQRREYEKEIGALRGQVEGFREQLDDLQRRLQRNDPPE